MIQNNSVVIKKPISQKLFWTLYILSNLVWLPYFILTVSSFWLLFLAQYALLFGIVVNIVLLLTKKLHKRKLFIISAYIFIVIGFLFHGGSYVLMKVHQQKQGVTMEELDAGYRAIKNAKSFEDCKQIGEKIKDTGMSLMVLEACFKDVLNITNNLDACLIAADSVKYDKYQSLRSWCIKYYVEITKDEKDCDLYMEMLNKDGRQYTPDHLADLLQQCKSFAH